ncbi:MAG: hypothetical protein DSY33_05215 [Archaeoglobus sp.]|nr:MAG: hypothetical protein DSY33_05215 [Archaeoglobus sp.]
MILLKKLQKLKFRKIHFLLFQERKPFKVLAFLDCLAMYSVCMDVDSPKYDFILKAFRRLKNEI